MSDQAGHENTDAVEGELTEGADPTDETAPEETDETAFLNRAARRAQGKGATRQEQPQAKGKSFGGRGSVQGPRQWGTRRSG